MNQPAMVGCYGGTLAEVAMAKISGREFSNETVYLDGNEYHGCKFRQCRMVFKGTSEPGFSGCSFDEGCSFVFEDAASRTLNFLQALAEPKSGLSNLIKNSFPKLFGH